MNGDPGLSKVLITVNKKQFALRGSRTASVAPSTSRGPCARRGNTITFRPRGRPGASAIAIAHDW